MKFLHDSEIEVHGQLTSFNCIIDSRWLLKITNFGIPKLYHLLGEKPEKRPISDLLWSAPELLRRSASHTYVSGTREADIYSFSMIMSEILMSDSLMNLFLRNQRDRIEDIIDRLQNPFPVLCRPKITLPPDVPETTLSLLHKCWSENTEERPSFNFICASLKRITDGGYESSRAGSSIGLTTLFNRGHKTRNIVDDMFHKLEKYSGTLEEMVRERTELLEAERSKTDALLMRMLPT